MLQFILQMLEMGPGVPSGHVQNEEEETAALYVTQKREAQAAVEMGPPDDARDVGNCTEERSRLFNMLLLLQRRRGCESHLPLARDPCSRRFLRVV